MTRLANIRRTTALSGLSELTGQYSYPQAGVLSKKLYFSFRWNFFRRRGPASCRASWRIRSEKRDPCEVTILFVAVRVPLKQPAARWAEDCDQTILRRCPVCELDSIVGHGRRRKQAHDEYHDWIGIRRGICSKCGKTFTFLPLFSLPYTHYSLLARCEALLWRFVERCSWEKAAPKLKSADRLPDASTMRRWSEGKDGSQPAGSFLRQAVGRVIQWQKRGQRGDTQVRPLPWMVSALEVLWPLRL
jgi:hypothetical protein